ncbi:MAG: MFS transporter [Chloroflexi bacterium]|nr:MFS transporter [Chloroflexota bacterium]
MSRKSSRIRQGLAFMRGNMLVLTATRILGQFGRSMAFPYASLYILSLGGEPAQIGFINSLAPLAGLLVFPIGGYITDHAGRVRLIGLAGLFSGLVYLLYVFARSWEVLAVAAFLQGFMAIQFPPQSALIADSLSPQDRGRGIALLNSLGGAPSMLAPYVAGLEI